VPLERALPVPLTVPPTNRPAAAPQQLHELIYRQGTVISLRERDSDWVWDVLVQAQEGEGFNIGGMPAEPGRVYPLLVMEDLGRRASPFLIASMCATASASGAIVTTATDELYHELQGVIGDVLAHGVTDGQARYSLDESVIRHLQIWPPSAVDLVHGRLLANATPEPGSPPTPLPTDLPQQTFPEAKAIAIALADGPLLRRWIPIEGETALRHMVSRDARLQTKLVGAPLLDWLGMPNSVDSLREELQRAGLPAVLLLHVCIGSALEHTYVTASVDDLIAAIGWQPRSRVERAGMRFRLWRWLALFDSMQVIGRRPGRYRDPDTHEMVDLTSVDALIRLIGRRMPAQLAFDASTPPIEVSFVAGPWIQRWAGNRHILTYFGDVRKLASIPSGKPSGLWAQAIGLALQQWWREQSARAELQFAGTDGGISVRFPSRLTRRVVLDMFPPTPSADEILHGDHPSRARHYWNDAIELLKRAGVIADYRELDPLRLSRKNWQAAWLDQELDVRPTDHAKDAVAQIAHQAQSRRGRGLARRARASA
jgi:hypothetical protein